MFRLERGTRLSYSPTSIVPIVVSIASTAPSGVGLASGAGDCAAGEAASGGAEGAWESSKRKATADDASMGVGNLQGWEGRLKSSEVPGASPGLRITDSRYPLVLFNYSTKELTAKVVYYGAGLCGKTTNLQWIHEQLPIKNKGKMLSLATEADRTLFFDFLPIELGTIRGVRTRIQIYTVPGQVFYESTRRMVLKGCDAVVFVADSQAAMLDANAESLLSLRQNLIVN